MAQMMMVNPRRRKSRRKTTSRRRRNPVTALTKTRRRRRNPVKSNPIRRRRRGYRRAGLVKGTLIPAATAAAGAVGFDVVWGYLPIPDTIKSGTLRYVAKGAGAIALGLLAEKMVGRSLASQITAGALTVVMSDAMRGAVSTYLPTVALGEYVDMGYVNSAPIYGQAADMLPGVSQYGYQTPTPTPEMGEYIQPGFF